MLSTRSRVAPSGGYRKRSVMDVSVDVTGLPSVSGLTSRTNRRMEMEEEEKAQHHYELRKMEFIRFVRDNFKRKECTHFVPKPNPKRKPDDPVKCHCGDVSEKHIKGTVGISNYYKEGMNVLKNDLDLGKAKDEWKAKDDIHEFQTNAFGKIDFIHEGLGGRKPSKYVRLADDTPVETVMTLLKDHWQMNRPEKANLVITVIGGAKNCKLDGKKKEIFNRGLVEAAQTTHAWIITSGCNMGIMKAVGEAVAEGQTYNWDKHGMTHSLRCIGIAPWGYVEERHCLVSDGDQGLWNAQYKVNNIIQHGQPVSLNHNHTHFLLVDDGMRGSYRGVAEFRARLERKLSSPANPTHGEESGENIPVVLVVVEGGYDALDDVHRSISHRIPVVVCKGTGRAADILAYSYTNFVTTRSGERKIKPEHQKMLEGKLCAAYGETWAARSNEEKELAKYMKVVMDCCQDEKLITVFDMNKNEDLDLAILSALLKGQGAKNADQLLDQLKLAITWNRSDVAEEKIFNQGINWGSGRLDDIMTEALTDGKVNFVRLLLQNGLVMKEYLTVSRLRQLYNSAPKMSHLRLLLSRESDLPIFCLRDVGELLRKLIGHHNDESYQNDNNIQAIMIEGGMKTVGQNQTFEKPFRELFLWSVLMNRQDMARFLWERGNESIPSALAACKINLSLAHKVAHYNSDLLEQYNSNKQEFEQLAVKVLDECHNTDPEKATALVQRKYRTWGDITCLEMAANTNAQEFLSSLCCQNTLDLMWKKGIASHWFFIMLAILFPFLIVSRIRYMHDTLLSPMTAMEKIRAFYGAPSVKFAAHVFMYVIFLVLYCYMLLFSFRPTITILEWITLGWIFTLLIEEIREMLWSSKASTLFGRLHDWWMFSIFNRIDLVIVLLALLGFILRMVPGYFMAAKSVYAINCVFFFLRVLREYSASSFLGPKLVMIARMLEELILYIMILAVFLLAYGVSSLSLMYPVRDFYSLVFKDITYFPYWQIYGELYLEDLEGRTDDCLGNSTLKVDGTPCPHYSWLVPVLTALYLLVGNLLLLNILIAIFNNVFNEIQTNSFQIWKYGLYFLVVEYDQKPILAPPFIIFEHIFLAIRWVFHSACCKEMEADMLHGRKNMLDIFERECCKQVINSSRYLETGNIDSQIQYIQHRVDEMAKDREEKRMLEQQIFEIELNEMERMKSETGQERPGLLSRRSRSLMKALSPRYVKELLHQDSEVSMPATEDNATSLQVPERIEENRNIDKDDNDNNLHPETSGAADDNVYDELNFDQMRRTLPQSHYSQIGGVVPGEQTDAPSQMEQPKRSELDEVGRGNASLPDLEESVNFVKGKLEDLESRLEKMEEDSRKSLYNIEALLRNAVFYGSSSRSNVRQRPRPPYIPNESLDLDIDRVLNA